MNERRIRIGLAATALACLAGIAGSVQAVRISGLSPLGSVAAEDAQVAVQGGSLHIRMPQGGEQIVVSPWPAYLPQRFARQQVLGARTLHPSGPSDRIALSAAGETEPWLIISSGMRPAQPVIGSWTLQHDDGRWSLRNGQAWRLLRPAKKTGRAVEVGSDGERWCVYLLDAQPVPAANRGIAQEGEPQAALAVMRAEDGRCRRPGG